MLNSFETINDTVPKPYCTVLAQTMSLHFANTEPVLT